MKVDGIRERMKRYRPSDQVDFCVVGVGAAGGVLTQRLSRAGFSVVGLEAGPFWDSERDWVSDDMPNFMPNDGSPHPLVVTYDRQHPLVYINLPASSRKCIDAGVVQQCQLKRRDVTATCN